MSRRVLLLGLSALLAMAGCTTVGNGQMRTLTQQQAAERIVKMQQDEDAWRAKYADYASQRARIEAMGLTAAERDAQIAQLREHAFANVGERLRAASLDLGSAH